MIKWCLFLVFLLNDMVFECLVRIVGFFGLCVLNRLVMCGRLLVMFLLLLDFWGIWVSVLFIFILVLLFKFIIVLFGRKYWVGMLVFGIRIFLLFVLISLMVGCMFLFVVGCVVVLVILFEDRLVRLFVWWEMVMLLIIFINCMWFVILVMIGMVCVF